MKKLYFLLATFSLLFLVSFTVDKTGTFIIQATIGGFEDGTAVLLVDGATNEVKDSTYFKNNRFEFIGETSEIPQNFVIYIPYEGNPKFTYIYMADEDVTVEGNKEDFPDKLIVKGSVHQKLKTDYDSKIAKYNLQLGEEQKNIQTLQQQKKWNDSLQKKYFGENGILSTIDNLKTVEEKRFIKENTNSYFGLQILYYKKSFYSDKQLKKIYSKFSKKLQETENGKSIQAYLDNPSIKKGDEFVDFSGMDKNDKVKKLSESFDGKKYVLVDFSTPTCPNSKAAIPMLKALNKEYSNRLNIVTYYTENKKEHFEIFSKLETTNWCFIWTEKGKESSACIRYRVNSTPTYFLFSPDGKLIEKWSGFQKDYSDATQTKIEQLIGVK